VVTGGPGRALQDGGVELLGGFSSIPPMNQPGWIIKATRCYSRVPFSYYIGVVVTGFKTKVIQVAEDSVPWDTWDGDKSDNPLYQGDLPEKYKEFKDAKRTEV